MMLGDSVILGTGVMYWDSMILEDSVALDELDDDSEMRG